MTRFLITSMMTLTFVFGGLAISSSSAQACDSCEAHKKTKGKKSCDKCKKAGKKSCECSKKKSDVNADQLAKCGKDCKCAKCAKGCDCGKKDCSKCDKKDCNCAKKDCSKCKKSGKKGCGCK